MKEALHGNLACWEAMTYGHVLRCGCLNKNHLLWLTAFLASQSVSVQVLKDLYKVEVDWEGEQDQLWASGETDTSTNEHRAAGKSPNGAAEGGGDPREQSALQAARRTSPLPLISPGTLLNQEERGGGHPSAPGSTFVDSNSLIKSQKLGILES